MVEVPPADVTGRLGFDPMDTTRSQAGVSAVMEGWPRWGIANRVPSQIRQCPLDIVQQQDRHIATGTVPDDDRCTPLSWRSGDKGYEAICQPRMRIRSERSYTGQLKNWIVLGPRRVPAYLLKKADYSSRPGCGWWRRYAEGDIPRPGRGGGASASARLASLRRRAPARFLSGIVTPWGTRRRPQLEEAQEIASSLGDELIQAAAALIVKGKERGYLTPDEILECFSETEAEPDHTFRIFAAFKRHWD